MADREKEKKTSASAVFLIFGVISLAVVLLIIFGSSLNEALTDFLDFSSEETKVNSYVINETEKKDKISIKVPYVGMSGEFPTGCESASALMLLAHADVEVSFDEFVDTYLEKAELKKNKKGNYIGPSPEQAFIGNPRELSGYGCFAPVIEKSLNQVLADKGEEGMIYEVRNLTGSELLELESYIDQGYPVMIWATNHMGSTSKGTTWTVTGTKETFTWPRGEHSMVLKGYSSKYYYFLDPMDKSEAAYEKKLVEKRYEELGKQAIVIVKNDVG